jgi:hypothetical protein
MDDRKLDKQMVFIHIPRSVGTAFIGNLRIHFPVKVAPYNMWEHFITATDLDSYDFLGGHINYQVVDLLTEEPLWMTLLSEPINRAYSHYKYMFDSPFIFDNVLKMMTFEEFIFSPFWNRMINNLQARTIGANFKKGTIPSYMDFLLNVQPTPKTLDTAKRRLEQFFFVGIKERLNESIVHLNNLLEIRVPLYGYPPTPYSRGLSYKLLAKLEEINQLDIELYKFGMGLFEDRINGDN